MNNHFCIKIKGKNYPLRMTMGALLRFKHQTGYDVSELKDNDIEGLITLLWCCIASASKADGIPFELNIEDMADCLSIDDIQQATNKLYVPTEKKTTKTNNKNNSL